CFPHIVNLACKAVLAKITNMDFAKESELGSNPTFLDDLEHDPVATLRGLIRSIRSSSLRRQDFAVLEKQLCKLEVELIRDVDTRWSSTLLMIRRALDLDLALDAMVDRWPELEKYRLSEADWDALCTAECVLEVPHSFQQLLSHEKTTSLGRALPAFEALKESWEKLKRDDPNTADIINAGLDKLSDYRELAEEVPAYVMAMRES
ncbi:hypothetical protein BKA70DRAFT_1103998, partial [Coprinopsis sp. MPI-PUGE-AT-0042]